MRITTIDELAAYLRTEIVRIHAEQATLGEDVSGDTTSPLRSHLEGELAAVRKTLAMVSDDAFAQLERQASVSDDRLRPGTAGAGAEGDTGRAATPVGVAVTPEWPAG